MDEIRQFILHGVQCGFGFANFVAGTQRNVGEGEVVGGNALDHAQHLLDAPGNRPGDEDGCDGSDEKAASDHGPGNKVGFGFGFVFGMKRIEFACVLSGLELIGELRHFLDRLFFLGSEGEVGGFVAPALAAKIDFLAGESRDFLGSLIKIPEHFLTFGGDQQFAQLVESVLGLLLGFSASLQRVFVTVEDVVIRRLDLLAQSHLDLGDDLFFLDGDISLLDRRGDLLDRKVGRASQGHEHSQQQCKPDRQLCPQPHSPHASPFKPSFAKESDRQRVDFTSRLEVAKEKQKSAGSVSGGSQTLELARLLDV